MRTRRLGPLTVSALGLGCTGMSEFYGHADEAQGVGTIHRALELGITFLDTSGEDGHGANERMVGKAISGRRDEAVVATRFAGRDPREACEHSLRRLGVDAIDLYSPDRLDPLVPIEETVGAMAELVVAGMVRHLGLRDARPETIRRAHATHPLAAVHADRDAPIELLPTCRALGIGLVADVPLAPPGEDVVGMLSIRDGDRLAEFAAAVDREHAPTR
jgi:aryl-alcohol dehydrogenase-like predicted oxidoreductase